VVRNLLLDSCPFFPNDHRYYGFGVADGGVAVPQETGVGWIRYQVPQGMQHRFYTGTVSATVSNERFRIAADGKVSLGPGGSLEAIGDLNIGTSTATVNIGSAGGIVSIAGLKLPTTGGTSTTLSFFEEQSWSTTFTGPFTTPAQPFRLSRIGSTVTITMQTRFAGTSTSAQTFKSTSMIPLQFRPAGNGSRTTVSIVNDGTINTLGYVEVDGDGKLMVCTYTGLGSFNATGTVGCEVFSVTYVRPAS